MLVLVDTPIWSLALRRTSTDLNPRERHLTKALRELIRDGRAQLVGPIRQELLSGIRPGTSFRRLRDQMRAFDRFPDNRLHFDQTNQRYGNIIINANGEQDARDHHNKLAVRIQNYLIGVKPVVVQTPAEVSIARERTLPILKELFDKPDARRVSEVIGRNKKMNDKQIENLLAALDSLKAEAGRASRPR